MTSSPISDVWTLVSVGLRTFVPDWGKFWVDTNSSRLSVCVRTFLLYSFIDTFLSVFWRFFSKRKIFHSPSIRRLTVWLDSLLSGLYLIFSTTSIIHVFITHKWYMKVRKCRKSLWEWIRNLVGGISSTIIIAGECLLLNPVLKLIHTFLPKSFITTLLTKSKNFLYRYRYGNEFLFNVT